MARPMGKPGDVYRPPNGTDGRVFMARTCDRCERDREYRAGLADSCRIACLTLLYRACEPEYPREWTYDEDGRPTCTAFAPERPIPPAPASDEAALPSAPADCGDSPAEPTYTDLTRPRTHSRSSE